MKKSIIKSKKGFTIIEVVLVLAIAGLIFLMVFVALPNLQRTQRDTQRRNDLDRVSTALTQYITNNNSLPSDNDASFQVESANVSGTNASAWQKFTWNYLLAEGADTFEDPNGSAYGFSVSNCTVNGNVDNCNSADLDSFGSLNGTDINAGVVVVMKNASCQGGEGGDTFTQNKGSRKFAVAMKLEGNGTYCVDNS